ncbi:MAG: hypothetical protein NTX73_13030 [Rhodobacterales bacterium]|jgi:hypothetical protein|nr:hypothetical protein [Rhodobacterales bacterium]
MSAFALLDTLIPGDADFPAGGRIATALAAHDRFGPQLAAILDLLPPNFRDADPDTRFATLTALESAHPEAFGALIVAAYSLYYTDPAVIRVIGRLTGHSAAPPQPQGHALPPFDPAMVAIPAARPPLYRPTPKANP